MATKKTNTKTNNNISNNDSKLNTRNGVNKHNGGYAGDGQDLVPTKENGELSNRDKYGNLVTENTGRGKGVILKDYYTVANRNIAAPTPDEIAKNLTRPYFSINDMPLEYIYNNIMEYFTDLVEPVYKQVPKLDENENPIKDENGNAVMETRLVGCNYKNTPTIYGLAQSLGVDKSTLFNYLNTKQFNTSDVYDTSNIDTKYNYDKCSYNSGYNSNKQTTKINSRNKLVDWNNTSIVKTLVKIYGNSIYEERNKFRTEKDYKIDIIKRARTEIMKYHEQRLGVNENVSGSMFALLNSNDGWTNDHKITLDIPSVLGRVMTAKELDAMNEDSSVVLEDDGNGNFIVPKDFDD